MITVLHGIVDLPEWAERKGLVTSCDAVTYTIDPSNTT